MVAILTTATQTSKCVAHLSILSGKVLLKCLKLVRLNEFLRQSRSTAPLFTRRHSRRTSRWPWSRLLQTQETQEVAARPAPPETPLRSANQANISRLFNTLPRGTSWRGVRVRGVVGPLRRITTHLTRRRLERKVGS